jgi:hypothetical protein
MNDPTLCGLIQPGCQEIQFHECFRTIAGSNGSGQFLLLTLQSRQNALIPQSALSCLSRSFGSRSCVRHIFGFWKGSEAITALKCVNLGSTQGWSGAKLARHLGVFE